MKVLKLLIRSSDYLRQWRVRAGSVLKNFLCMTETWVQSSVRSTSHTSPSTSQKCGGMPVYWLVLCANVTTARVIIEKGVSVKEMPP